MTLKGVAAVLPFVFVASTFQIVSPYESEKSRLSRDSFLEQQVRVFKMEYHRILETERVRRKRDAGLMLSMSYQGNSRELQKLEAVEDLNGPLSEFRVTCWTWIQPDPAYSPILLLLVTDDGQLVVVTYDGQGFNVNRRLHIEDRAYRAQVFVSGPYIWFAVAHQSRRDGHHYIQMYCFDGVVVYLKQMITLSSEADISVIYNRGYWYLVATTHNRLTLFEWRQTQFDEVVSAPVFGLRSVALWRSAGVIYIATAVSSGRGGSPLFSYTRRNGGKLSRLQVLPVQFAKKVLNFRVDGNDYLLFVCQDFVVLFWWAGNLFLEYQVFENSAEALDASVLILPNKEAAIALSFKHEIRFYVEGYSSEYYMVFSRSLNVDLSSGVAFFLHADMYFLFLTFDLEIWDAKHGTSGEKLPENIWRLNVTNYDPQGEENPLSACISSVRKSLEANGHTLDYVETNLDKVLVTNKEQTIEAPVVVAGEIEVTEGLNVEHVILIPSDNLTPVPQVTNGALRDDILLHEQELNSLIPNMDNLLYKSRDQVINGDLIFMSPFKAVKLQLTSVVNDVVLSGIPVSVLAENALHTQGEQTLMHRLHVTHLESQNVVVDGTINGISTQDVILLHEDEIIESELHFTNIKAQDIDIKDPGTINGIRPSVFVIRDETQKIHGVKTFHNVIVQKDVIIHGKTNQHDLSVFVQNIVRLDQPDQINWDNVILSAPLTVDGDVYVEGLINGIVDLRDLSTRALDLTTDQLITGKKTVVNPLFVDGNVIINGTTNGIDVSKDVLTLSTDQYIPGTTIFETVEVLGDLSTDTVNGYDLRMEAVTTQGPPQSILGHKTFKQTVQVVLDVDIQDGSTLNGLDLSDLVQAASKRENSVLLGATNFHSLVIQEMVALDSINGISLDHLYNNLWMKSTEQVINVPVQFLQPVVFESNLEVLNSINGYDLTEDFVHTSGDEEISGYVRFTDDVNIRGGLNMDPGKTINGFDVSDYNRSMVPSQHNTVIHSQVVVPSLDVKGSLKIAGTIGGINLDNFLQVDKPQEFTGHVTLSGHTAVSGGLTLDSLFLDRDINGVDFSEFNRHVVYDFKTRDLSAVQNKDFIGGLEGAKLDVHGTVNGIDLDDWYLKAVRLSTDDEISGFKSFSAVELLGGCSSETLNDVPLSEHLSSVVLKTADHIRGAKTIQGSVTVIGDLTSSSHLNGIDLAHLESVAAFAEADNDFSGVVTVDGNLELESLKLEEQSSLDGLPWNQLVFLDQNHALPGVSTFLDEINAVDVTVRHSVSGCNIQRLAQEAIYTGQPFPALNEPLTVRKLVVHGDTNVSGRVGGVDVKSLAEGVLKKSGKQRMAANVHFQDLHAQNVHLKIINGLDFPEFMRDAVVKSQPQTISAVKSFVHMDGVTFLNDINVLGDVDVDDHVCGVDLSQLQEDAVLKAGEQIIEGLKTFHEVEVQGDIYINGLVNGLSIPSEMILLNMEEEIKAPLILQADSRVAEHLYVGRHLDGVLFQQFVDNRVTLLHNQEISAQIEFQDTLETDSMNVQGEINGVSVTELVFRHSRTHVLHQKVFENSLTIQGDLEVHKLNGFDLPEFNRELVRVNQPQEISSLITFVTDLEVQNDLLIEDSVNNIDVKGLEEEFANYHLTLKSQLQSMQEQMGRLDSQVQINQQQLLTRQFWHLLHFQPIQSLNRRLTRLFADPLQHVINLDEDMLEGNIEKVFGWSSLCAPTGCCGASTTELFGVDRSGHLHHENVEPGRLFPLFTAQPLADDNLLGFFIWTNTTPHTQMCSAQQTRAMSIISIERGSGLVNALEHTHPVFSPAVLDARLFKANGDLQLLITYAYNKFAGNATQSTVFRYDKTSLSWFLLQPLGGLSGTTSLDLTLYTDRNNQKHLLATLADHATVYVYRWTDMQFQLLNTIPTPSTSASLWVRATGKLYLLLSNDLIINIYAYLPESTGHKHLTWVQGLDISGVNILKAFVFSGESFVVAGSQSIQELIILQWRGADGFVPIQHLSVPGVRDVAPFWTANRDFVLAVASDCETLILKAVSSGFGHHH